MSNPVVRIDVTAKDKTTKVGEIQLNDDFTLEGFLFEETWYAAKAIFEMDPRMLSFSISASTVKGEVKTDGDSHVHNG